MACEWVKFAGTVAIVCSHGKKPKWCVFCHERPATRLCDFKVGGRTCDAAMCDECATHIAANTDYCPDHRRYARQGELFA